MKKTLDWQHYLDTAAQAVAEGIVLLKNDNALPLAAGEEVALFGRIQLHYYKSGTGSGGMVNVSKVVGIPEGLEAAGVPLNRRLMEVYREWDAAHPFDPGDGWGHEPWAQEEMPLDETLVREIADSAKTAVVIIGRTAGEEQDNRAEKGSYYLNDNETEMLRLARKYFEKVVVLLNTGNIIDMRFMDDHAPDAVLYVWQGGMTGGVGTAQVLTGAVSPSGKLPDTIAYSVSDYPSDPYFGVEKENIYSEDIYVGYRYFETFAKEKVRYPFGFGMSYTTFSYQTEQQGNTLAVTVTNTGSRAGKETVQLYCEAPQGKLGKPARVLTGFAKTNTLAPGEKQTLQLPLELPLSYDDSGVTGTRFCYVTEAGEYKFYVGGDVRSASLAAAVTEPQTRVHKQCRQAMPPVRDFQRMKAVFDNGEFTVGREDTPTICFDEAERRRSALPEEWLPTGKSCVLADVLHKNATLREFIAQLSDEELASIVRGEGMGSPRVTPGTASAFGGVTDALVNYGIPAGCCSDGPSGMRMDSGAKAFSLPNGTLLAATFNKELLTELFYCLGLEMTANRVDCLLGPGLNIHRHPLNGRNFEYFSEDPYLTGQLAAAELCGLHKAGVTGTVKHCCGNNQETNRHYIDSVVSERALREIYLRGFQIAVENGADSIMTTYGSVNGLWTASHYDLCTEIIRGEWGFEGILMTDWYAQLNDRNQAPDKTNLAAMVRAQNDVYMVCSDCAAYPDNILASLENGTLTRAELQRSAANICGFLLKTNAMKRLVNEEEAVEIINRPAEETESSEPIVFYDMDENFTLPLNDIRTDKGSSFAFALKLKNPAWYNVTITASSELSELAQLPVTIFAMGTASGTFTFNGTGGKSVSITKRVPMFSSFTSVRLYFAQSGLKTESITFEPASKPIDIANLGDI